MPRSDDAKGNRAPRTGPRVVSDRTERFSRGVPPQAPRRAPPPLRTPTTPQPQAKKAKATVLSPERCVVGTHGVTATLMYQAARARLLYAAPNADEATVALARSRGIPVQATGLTAIDAMSGGLLTQGLLLACEEFPTVDVEDFGTAPRLTLALDGVEDPRNLGAAARAAFALGAELLVVPYDRAAAPTASAIRTSVGALCRIPLVRATNFKRALELLKERGAWIVGAEADGTSSPWEVDLTVPTVLVVGGEDRGLRRLTREACDHVVSIPMAAKDMSLNAADAATLLLYEVVRQRAAQSPS
jgi:23S rRNA (guanosine2251-2'-O)-methyltransferase